MRTSPTITVTIFCLLIAGVVVLSGLRAKELASVMPAGHGDIGHQSDDRSTKVTPELHHHGDTSLKVQNNGDGHQADTRSLRLLGEHKKDRARLANRSRHWWQLSFLQFT